MSIYLMSPVWEEDGDSDKGTSQKYVVNISSVYKYMCKANGTDKPQNKNKSAERINYVSIW